MKIKKIRIKTLLKLNLLKVYEQSVNKTRFNDFALNQIIVNLKKVLEIIFYYNKARKKILFIGLPYKLELEVNQSTKHLSIPKNFDIQGIISNFPLKNRNLNKSCSKKYSRFLLPKFSKKLDLIVLFDCEKSKAVISEAKIAKIPIVCLETFKNISTSSNKNIFFIGLNFLLKRNTKIGYTK